MKHRLVATAGHVDHGKTALLKNLTGTDADRLDEEKERGLTIDLGFADLVEDDCHLGFIDVPGHHNFIKNMVSGVGSVQGVLFVVSAVDGWQEQSREHFEIINLLEPDVVVFAISKVDLADEDLALLVEAELEEAVEGTAYEDPTICRVSSETGDGVDGLRSELVKQMKEAPDSPDHGKPYCPIDRVFSVKGQGTVVTGSLSGGNLRTEDSVVCEPLGKAGRVRGLQQYHEDVDVADRAARVAVNVPDWDQDGIGRGDVLTVPDAGQNAAVFDGMLETPRHLSGELSHDQQVLGYLGTDRFESRVLTPDQVSYGRNEQGLIRVKRLEGQGFLRPGDRVILRDFSDRRLLGCVTVTTVNPDASLAGGDYRDWVNRRFPVTAKSYLETELEVTPAPTLEELAGGTRFSTSALRTVAGEDESVRFLGEDRLVRQQWWDEQLDSLLEAVDAYHAEYSHKPGFPLSDLPDELKPVRDEVYQECRQRGYVVDNDVLRRDDFKPGLGTKQKQRFQEMTETLREDGIEPPDRDRLESQYSEELVEFGIETDELVELSDGRVIERSVFEDAREDIEDFMADGDPKRLSEIRDHLGSSRKYVIPLMEFLDQRDVTVRDGDVRYLAE